MLKKPIFTCDLEDWNDALHISKNGHTSKQAVDWLEKILLRYKVNATFYVLGKFKEEFPEIVHDLEAQGHTMKSHGLFHYRGEIADREPYSIIGFCGGFWMRLFPYWLIKIMVLLYGHLYIHPHDLDEEHPPLRSWLFNWKRHVGLWTARKKLERLLKEIKFGRPG